MNGFPSLIPVCVLALATMPSAAAAQTESSLELSLDSLLSTPVSTVSKYDQKQTDAPAFVTIITGRDIRQFGFRTLEDVLKNQAGFYVGNDREYADVGLRGFGRPGNYNNQILLLVDGHSLNDIFTGGARFGSALGVDLDALDRIEIVRGPGSSVYGARAMLAVVNIVTSRGRDLDGLEVVGALGNLGTREASVRYGAVRTDGTDVALFASWGESEGEDIYFPEFDSDRLNGGMATGLDWERYARGLATIRRGGLTFQTGGGVRKKGIPTAAYHTTFNHPDARVEDHMAFTELRYERPVAAAATLTLRGYADAYRNKGVYPLGAVEGPTQGSVNISPALSNGSVGGEARLRWDLSQKHRLIGGIEAQRAFRASLVITGSPEAAFRGDYPYSVVSAFVQDELQVTPQLSVTLGLRRDQYSIQGSATTPRGAIVYHATPTATFKVMAGEAFRAPNVYELFVRQPSVSLINNPALDPERVRTIELIWEQRFPRVATVVSVFHNKMDELIDLVEIEVPDSLRASFGRLAYEQQNIARARARGVEAEARTFLPLGILARVGYGFQDARDQATGSVLINSPRHQFILSATKDGPGGGQVGASMRAQSGRRTVFGTTTPGFTVVDLSLTSPTLVGGLTARASATNILDTRYSTPGGFQHLQTSLPQPGRRVALRISWTW